VSAVDLPPGIGLVGHPLGRFTAPPGARRLARRTAVIVVGCGALTWVDVARHPYREEASALVVLPVALALVAALGVLIRRAEVAVTRDGVRWGWATLGFHQRADRLKRAHVFVDGVAFESRRGGWWVLAARDWERFDALVRQLRRTQLTLETHAGRAPWRARSQAYGRFLDAVLVASAAFAGLTLLWSL
jgi:hypothetical protein